MEDNDIDVKITVFQEGDEKVAKLMEQLIKSEWKKYGDIFDEIVKIQVVLQHYGVRNPERLFSNLIRVIVERLSITPTRDS